MTLPETISEDFKNRFSDELVRNVFRPVKRTELCLNEEDILNITRSDRGMSIDETNHGDIMKLKKTTVLTGNHPTKQ